MTGQEKIPLLLTEKSQEIVNKLAPPLASIAIETGIQNIGTPEVKLPDTCVVVDRLNSIASLRDELLDILSQGADIIKNITQITIPLGVVVDITDATLKTLNTTKTATTAALQVTPSPSTPPPITAALTNLQKFINTLGPKLNTTKNILKKINTALGIVEGVLFTLISMLKSIDEYLNKCGVNNLTPYSDYLNDIENRFSQLENIESPLAQEYQGFILEIVEEPYTPTVTRRKAVAKNKSDIILLQTPLSFTTDSQILIEDLKLAIDRDNLKAD